MPFSISTVSCVGEPSSSTFSDPRRPSIVPLSTTVTLELATGRPISPLNAEVPLRLKSASSPWPTASCSSTPGHPGPSTTSISPAGAATAPSCRIAPRAASCARLLRALGSGELPQPRASARACRAPGGVLAVLAQSQTRSAGTAAACRWQTSRQNPRSECAAVPLHSSPAPARCADRTPAPRGPPAESAPAAPPGPDRIHPAAPDTGPRPALRKSLNQAASPGLTQSAPRSSPRATAGQDSDYRYRRIRSARRRARECRIRRSFPGWPTSRSARPRPDRSP